ncbi:hypothetical protein Tco_0455243 [Tanacetum coccineum]
MDQDSAHIVVASKVPMLKPENGATLPKIAVAEGVKKVMPITSAEDKTQRRLEVKARSTLMMDMTGVISRGKGHNYANSWLTPSSSSDLKGGLEPVEEKLEFYKKNESVYVEKINDLKWDIQIREITIRELRK